MRLSKIGIDFLDDVEGRDKHEYPDSFGYPTIGIGHKLLYSEITSGKIRIGFQAVRYKECITDEQMDTLLMQDIYPVEEVINSLVRVKISQFQFDALCSFIHNIGIGAFEDSTLLRLLNQEKYGQIPFQMRRWNKGSAPGEPKKIVLGLSNRRELDILLWLNKWRVRYI